MNLLKKLAYMVIRLTFGGTIAARMRGVKIGQDCRIISTGFGTEPWLVSIGNRVTVAAGVLFITHDGSGWLVRDDKKGRRFRYARIDIGDNVFVGMNAILLPGVRVGNRVVVAAGSVVTKSIPSGSVVAGNPARIIMSYEEFELGVKQQWCTSTQMKGVTYEERINSVVESGFKPEMKV